MRPEEAYSIRLISDVKLSEIGLFHVETWIENEKYKSTIYVNKQKITSGENSPNPHTTMVTYTTLRAVRRKLNS